jgi:hypothetical protein
MRILHAATLIAVVGLVGCGASEAAKNDGNATLGEVEQADPSGKLANIKPCSLLTDEEIAAQVDLTIEPDQRAALHEKGTKHQISKEEDRSGAFPTCRITWRSVDSTGEQWGTGTFSISVMTATVMKTLAGADNPTSGGSVRQIEGVGDEAFLDRHGGAARRGDLAVSIAEFPDSHEGNGRVELLRAAAQRLQ